MSNTAALSPLVAHLPLPSIHFFFESIFLEIQPCGMCTIDCTELPEVPMSTTIGSELALEEGEGIALSPYMYCNRP